VAARGKNVQQGQIFRRNGSWYVRYYQDEIEDGAPVRKRVCKKLARYSDDYRSKKDLAPLLAEILSPVNSGDAQPEGSLTLTEFVEQRYLPSRAKKLRPSTMRSYRDLFRSLVRDRLGAIRLRDFHTKNGQHYFDKVADDMPHLSHQSLLRVKALLSSVFTYAKQEDAVRGANPVQGVKVEGRRYKPTRHAYALEDIQSMVTKLPEPARTVVMVAAFAGLRLSEIRGLRWDDYTGTDLRVSRSVWRTHVGPTKTEESGENPVPVIPILRRALDEHRKRYTGEGFIFAGERRGDPLNLDNLARRVITPKIGDAWKGWHSFRRGLGTNLYRLGVSPKVIQEILRHADVSTTETHYIVVDRTETKVAMQKLEKAVGKEWAKAKRRNKK
jgi:integrase